MNKVVQEYKCGDAKLRLLEGNPLILCMGYYNNGDINRCIALTKADIEQCISKKVLIDKRRFPVDLFLRGGLSPYKISIHRMDDQGFLRGSFKNFLFGLFPLYWCPLIIKPETISSLCCDLETWLKENS